MFKSFKKIFVPALFVGVFLIQFYPLGEVHAEDDFVCKGLITGTTAVSPNAGQSFFDAHGGPNGGLNADYYNNVVNMAVFGLGQGLAPGNMANAACVEKENGIAPYNAQPYEYKLRGYVFNSNLGFISLNCEAGFNDAGEGDGVACGAIDYGVYISEVGVDGNRKLFGYAWNPAFGWIDFNKFPLRLGDFDPQDCDPVFGVDGDGDGVLDFCGLPYGVRLAPNGDVVGSALSEAKVLMPFDGAKIFLPDVEPPAVVPNDPADWCNGKPYLCVMVEPYPERLKFGFEPDAVDANGLPAVDPGEEMKVADGRVENGYKIHLYLKNANGNGPIDPLVYNVPAFTNQIQLNWTDTVKIDQTSLVQRDYFNKKYPWREINNPGAVAFKPLDFRDFDPVAGDPGHYISKFPVTSYAPTSDGNISLTTGTTPAFPFLNEQFLHDVGVDVPAPNTLSLNSITYGPLVTKNLPVVTVLAAGAVYPNGKVGMSMKFRPPVEVNTLYADDSQDMIVAYRNIPMNFKIGARKFGNLGIADSEVKVDFHLAYSQEETDEQALCAGTDSVFDFHFLNDFAGALLPDVVVDEADANAPEEDTVTSFVNVLLPSLLGEKDLQAKATLPSSNVSPCATVAAPTLYSLVHYFKGGKEIKYYSNKLPRVSGDFISNPAVVVHGNVFAQMVRQIQKDVLVQTSGNVNVNIVRDTINENLEKYLTADPDALDKLCTITSLNANGVAAVGGCSVENGSNNYKKLDIGDEHVLYFKNKKVAMALNGGTFAGKWVIVSADGNIFVDKDIYNPPNPNVADAGASISLVAFRSTDPAKFLTTGNVYLTSCISGLKNIQATVIADGSVFSYFNGVKIWGRPGDFGVSLDNKTGEPVWGSYANMVGSLGCQLLIEGAVYSDNTIGGADLDTGENPKDYLLAGGGAVINLPAPLEDRMRAQYYDLNYLRMFRQKIEITPEGLPMDQQCGKGLTNQEIRQILAGEILCGALEPCIPGDDSSEFACNGIDTLNPVNRGGDLVTPKDGSSLAQGLDHNVEFGPVYIFYKAPSKDSFLFSKAGVVNLGGQ